MFIHGATSDFPTAGTPSHPCEWYMEDNIFDLRALAGEYVLEDAIGLVTR